MGKRAASKVAPGMEVVFEVTFRPQEVRSIVDLVCCTEREKFIVQVKDAGFRPRLSLPSEVDFGAAAVKSTKAKSMLVQNTGVVSRASDSHVMSRSFLPHHLKG